MGANLKSPWNGNFVFSCVGLKQCHLFNRWLSYTHVCTLFCAFPLQRSRLLLFHVMFKASLAKGRRDGSGEEYPLLHVSGRTLGPIMASVPVT